MKNSDGTDVERFDVAFLSQKFDLPAIGKSNSRFDRKKLVAFNADALGAMTDVDFLTAWRGWCERFAPAAAVRLSEMGDQRATWLARAVKPRCKTLRDALRPALFALTADDAIMYDDAAVKKALLAPIGKDGGGPLGTEVLARIRASLEALPEQAWEPTTLNGVIEQVASELGRPIGEIAPPLRVALTGTTVSPGFGETLGCLGRASVLARMMRCASLAR
jgi:glutamyl-tRNA synthetase